MTDRIYKVESLPQYEGLLVGFQRGIKVTDMTTGIHATCDKFSYQHKNRREAFRLLDEKLRAYSMPELMSLIDD